MDPREIKAGRSYSTSNGDVATVTSVFLMKTSSDVDDHYPRFWDLAYVQYTLRGWSCLPAICTRDAFADWASWEVK